MSGLPAGGFVVSLRKRLPIATCTPRRQRTRPFPRLPSEGGEATTEWSRRRSSVVGEGSVGGLVPLSGGL